MKNYLFQILKMLLSVPVKLSVPVMVLLAVMMMSLPVMAGDGASLAPLKVEGRYLVDDKGNNVCLHGFAQTFSPWFNERGTKWNNYDVASCLRYNKEKIDQILAAGWEMNFVRQHMDPYWSNKPGVTTTGENDISAFDMTRFKKYLADVFIPMAQYANAHGLYVVMRPPGVCPQNISIGDDYQKYLIKVWSYVASCPELCNQPGIMFELANEPVNILGPDGTYGSGTQGHTDYVKEYFQTIVNVIRQKGANNILWIPGLGYQSQYAGFASNPVKGENIGYAVHCYPGWYGSDAEQDSGEGNSTASGGGYASFRAGWNNQVQPLADIAPIMITEMDWAPKKYDSSWGKSFTGIMGAQGFGANFKKIMDNCGNASWLLFTENHLLAQYDDAAPDGNTFLTDPEACPRAIYRYYKEYAYGKSEAASTITELYADVDCIELLTGSSASLPVYAVFADGHKICLTDEAEYTVTNNDVVSIDDGLVVALKDGSSKVSVSYTDDFGTKFSVTIDVEASTFPLSANHFNPSIWETGTYDENTHTFSTGKYGFAGWKYNTGVDLSQWKYCVVKFAKPAGGSGLSFRLYDQNNYWTDCSQSNPGSNESMVVTNLQSLYSSERRKMDPSHIYYLGFWTYGGSYHTIEKIYLTNADDYTEGIDSVVIDLDGPVDVYDMRGILLYRHIERSEALRLLPTGIYIIGNKKIYIGK